MMGFSPYHSQNYDKIQLLRTLLDISNEVDFYL
jgi:hypothetical protein